MLEYVREGDHVVVHSMDRLARNLDDLRALVHLITKKKHASIEFVHEHLTFTGEDTPIANLLLSVMGAVAEFERSLIRERQLEGIALAKKRGAYKGRKMVLSADDITALQKQLAAPGANKAAVAREWGISRGTLYKYIDKKS